MGAVSLYAGLTDLHKQLEKEIADFYENPKNNLATARKYGAEYVYVSSYERSSYDVDEKGLATIGVKVFENKEASIYRLKVSSGQ